ncbi:energy transducer TonB [Cyclobacteriaceae bacterium]|jgi:protein TonB|nr:energy transducer TonB [Cyclobacteriaceae bacterium]MDA9905725.1 energy transducer TonB [Cyclobacteriaceae bacterium]MDB4315470.1 energy transducer TonB [Cyclobacteriaceae bacterium]MDC6483754.1 energy transducer TonB [Cyclobacteriaceae bacterium]|tara:strand:- start:1292 stop:1966 length:675 start_codon:yes stop_codon:yes gene_type:complete
MELKKNPKNDLSRMSGMFLNLGLSVSLLLVIVAFEWRTYDDSGLLDLGMVQDDFEDLMEIPPTEQPPPPPPKIQLPEIIEVPDEEEIEEEIEVELDLEVTEEEVVEDFVFEEAPEEEVDEVFTIVEDQPAFPGGNAAFYKFVGSNMTYPAQARRMGIEGRVFVQFVVDKDGSVTEVKAVKGIGAGCDQEAERVLKSSPNWTPGKQRGRSVKVRMVLPIIFKLNN